MMQVVAELVEHIPLSRACEVLGLPRSSWYRSRQPAPEPAVRSYPTPARALSPAEEERVLAVLNSERFVDCPPRTVYAQLLDEGVYLCHWRTMYRILDAYDEVRERRNQLQRPAYAKPELLATGPNQLWSWDITKLKGPGKGVYYYLYVIMDVFSRYVVGWLVTDCESAELAEQLIAESCYQQGIQRSQLTLHADRGGPMIAKTVAQLLLDLGVGKTHSRPYTPNDNPFSESQFKTMKYRHDYPDHFAGQEEALAWVRCFFPWYNNEHRHSSLGLMTPATIHYGLDTELTAYRQTVLLDAHDKHPERFVKGPPTPPQVPQAVWINPPVAEGKDG